ncbi:unnamed protein product [Fusarium graminearum]|uniref:Chromosome 3, complete genome n=1 Tax=Gibberella zeae (strain ATCC MYA-4620 / CBS 123657 / FGSC 9075 / NRRL 31084 / PH-1) TaxID=229533 RepID=A0A098E1R7_GIBZE|nr:unnamed protein product [Fusarium graminearum]CZS84392.1 unnamed protein product [Fusarium graminearum]
MCQNCVLGISNPDFSTAWAEDMQVRRCNPEMVAISVSTSCASTTQLRASFDVGVTILHVNIAHH